MQIKQGILLKIKRSLYTKQIKTGRSKRLEVNDVVLVLSAKWAQRKDIFGNYVDNESLYLIVVTNDGIVGFLIWQGYIDNHLEDVTLI